MCNGDCEKPMRYYGKLSQQIRRTIKRILPEQSRKGEGDKWKGEKKK